MPDLRQRLRARRAAIDTLPPAEQPAALAALADVVEDEAGLPGVARALRLRAVEAARAVVPPDAALVAALEASVRRPRITARSCLGDRPATPDAAAWPATPDAVAWKERMAALARGRRGRT